MSNTNYRVGDLVKVRCDAGEHWFKDRIHIGEVGTLTKIDLEQAYPYKVEVEGRFEWFKSAQIDLAQRDLLHLQAGDILLAEDDEEYKVVDVLPNSVLLSTARQQEHAGSWYTPKELEDDGFTLKQDTPAEVTELTLEDIAKLKGVDVSQIKIVEK